MAKKFFYVCGGLLILTLAYHVGASTAKAQTSGIQVGAVDGANYGAVVGRTVYRFIGGLVNGGPSPAAPVPGTSPIIALDPTTSGPSVLLENGDAYHWGSEGWAYVGNVLGSGTSSQQESWGSVKARYR